MNIADYERVNLNENLPAMITYVDEKILEAAQIHSISTHWHRSIEMSFVEVGEVFLCVNGKKKRIQAGEFIFVNSGEVHSIEGGNMEVARILIGILSYDFLKKVYPTIDEVYFDVQKNNPAFERLKSIFYSFKEYALHPQPLDYIKITGYLYEVLYLLLEHCQTTLPKSSTKRYLKDQERQRNILTYINDTYQDGITLEQVASAFYMSSEHFSRMFHKTFNIPFKTYVNDLRIYHAYEDVVGTKDTMQMIAQRYGFYNVKSFIESFKETYGQTPNRYRNMNKSKPKDI